VEELITGIFKTIDTNGFTVDNHARSNTNNQDYYLAFTTSADVAVGSYIGNSRSTKAITGLGLGLSLKGFFTKITSTLGKAVYDQIFIKEKMSLKIFF
jgi:hypothetical protein